MGDDHTAQRRAEKKASEESRLRNERHQRELAEKRRIEEERLAELEKERKLLKERLRKIELEEQAATKREALFDYKFGDKTNLASFRGLDINDVKKLRIGVFGPTGSGKSFFINTCVKVVNQVPKGPVTIGSSGGEETVILEDFLTDMFVNLVDTRGFFSYDSDEGDELCDILYGRLKAGDLISRKGDEKQYTLANADAPFSEWLHGIILVLKANDPRLAQGELKANLNHLRQILGLRGLSPVTVVTHLDTLHSQEARHNALESALAATGSSRSHTFFASYCPENAEPNVKTELEIFSILHFALVAAERYVKITKQQRKDKEMDEIDRALENATIGGPSDSQIVSNASIEIFFDVLQRKYKWKEVTVKNVLKELHEEEIFTLKPFADCWDQLAQVFPQGMRKMIQNHLKSMGMFN